MTEERAPRNRIPWLSSFAVEDADLPALPAHPMAKLVLEFSMNTKILSRPPIESRLPQRPCSSPSRLSPSKIAALVPMEALLPELGFHVNSRTRRAACRLHGGTNPSAFSWEEHGCWYCFNCGKGGDKFTLVEEVRNCGFKGALHFLAGLAGVALDHSPGARQELQNQQRERQRVDAGAGKLAAIERLLRLRYREELLDLHENRRNAGELLKALANGESCRWEGEQKFLGDALSFVCEHLPHASVSYQIMAFGGAELRIRFALNPDKRQAMIDGALLAGYISDDDGKCVEVPYE